MTRKLLWIPLLVAASACSDQIEVANELAVVEASGPPTLVRPGVVAFSFTISDFERDDQELVVIACEAGGTECGAPVRAPGSDRLDFVPAGEQDDPVEHRFAWAIGCGRLSAQGGRLATDLGASYEVAIRPRGRAEEIEAQFVGVRLDELGAQGPLSCEQDP